MQNEQYRRIRQAKEDIEALEQEKTDLKAKRPSMLAENEDISELNNRLKEIDDEIEICKDTILGVEEKLKSVENQLRDARRIAMIAFEEMVKAEMDKLIPTYQKYAKKLAEIIMDYNALEEICNSSQRYYNPAIPSDLEIPNLLNSNEPFLKHYDWDTTKEIRNKVREKYKLSEFSN